MGLIFQGDGYLYVVSSRTDEVKRYDEDDGEFVDNFVTASAGGLRYPVDLQFADDYLFVTSFWTHDVKRFDGETGEYVDDFVTAGRGGLNRPLGIRILMALSPPTDGDGTEPPGWGWIIPYLAAIVLLVSTVVWVGYIRKR